MNVEIYLITVAIIQSRCFLAIKDGLSDIGKGVGWTSWHVVGWLGRDIPIIMLLFVLWLLGFSIWYIILIIIFGSFHTLLFNWSIKNRNKFDGAREIPQWFNKMRSFWAWLPWVKGTPEEWLQE